MKLFHSMDNFSNTLIDVMAIKGLITQPEAATLRSLLSVIPGLRPSTVLRRITRS